MTTRAETAPLDDEARDYLNVIGANPPPPPPSGFARVEEFRRAAHAIMEISGEEEPVDDVEDTTVPGAEGDLAARAYRPAGAEGLLVYFHGGGFVRGDLDTHDPLCRRLANAAGCEVLSVAYRLAPEHPFPAGVRDAIAAVGWAAAHRGEPVGVGGDSSGGSLAAAVALDARDRGGPRLACQLLLYPTTDATLSSPSMDEFAEGRMLTRESMEWLYDQYLPDAADRTDPLASPLLAPSHEGVCPAIVVTAGHDPLRDDGIRYAERLEAAGVAVTHLSYGGTIHNFMLITGVLRTGLDATAAVGPQLAGALRNARNSG